MRQRNLTGVWTKIGQNDRIKSEKNGQINRTKSGTKKWDKIRTKFRQKKSGKKRGRRNLDKKSDKKVDKNWLINGKIKLDKKSNK